MIVEPLSYGASGAPLAPSTLALRLATAYAGATITTDPGYVHRARVSGSTPEHARQLVAQFVRQMDRVPGYVPISAKEYTVYLGPRNVRYGVDVVYAITEPARDRDRAVSRRSFA